MSEASKQATLCFVENVLHDSIAKQQFLHHIHSSTSQPSGDPIANMTEQYREYLCNRMTEYTNTITTEKLKEAKSNSMKLHHPDTSNRPLSPSDLFDHTFLSKFPERDAEMINELINEGTTADVQWISNTKKDKHLEITKSFRTHRPQQEDN